jgi:hypothetical protein
MDPPSAVPGPLSSARQRKGLTGRSNKKSITSQISGRNSGSSVKSGSARSSNSIKSRPSTSSGRAAAAAAAASASTATAPVEPNFYLKSQRNALRWVEKAKVRLLELADKKFGSLEALLASMDLNGDGIISFEEFSTAMAQMNVETLFPRSLQRTLFDAIDADRSGTLEWYEVDRFVNANTTSGASVIPASASLLTSPEHSNFEESDSMMQPEFHKAKLLFLQKLARVVPTACSGGLADGSTPLLKKRFAALGAVLDGEGRMLLSKDTLMNAVGPMGLNLGLDDSSVETLFQAMKQHENGKGANARRVVNDPDKLSLVAFTNYLSLDNSEPCFDAVSDGRRKTLRRLQTLASRRIPALSEEEAIAVNRLAHLRAVTAPDVSGLMPRETARRMTLSRSKSEPASLNRRSFAGHGGPWAEIDDAPDTAATTGINGKDLVFEHLRQKKANIAARVMAASEAAEMRLRASTWAHLGHGPGVDPHSSFFAPCAEGFATSKKKELRFGEADKAAQATRTNSRRLRRREHEERIRLAYAMQDVENRVKVERRLRAKANSLLNHHQWVMSMDSHWQEYENPQLVDFSKRQFPAMYRRQRAGESSKAALTMPAAATAAAPAVSAG